MNRDLVKLGDLVRIRTGKLDANANDPEGEYPFFTCAREPLRISTYSFDCECVLIAGNGDLNVKYFNGKFDAYQRTYIIESVRDKILNVRYLYHFMYTYLEKLRHMSIGGVIKYIKLGNLTEAKLPVPTLSEQRRIAAILDLADTLRVKRLEALTQLDNLRQSIFIEIFGDPVVNPKGWENVCLKSLLSMPLRNGLSPSNSGSVAAKVLTLSAITGDEFDTAAWKESTFQSIPPSHQSVNSSDFLICRGNGNLRLVGKGYFPTCSMVDVTFPDTMIAARIFSERIEREFLQHLWHSDAIRYQIETSARTTNGTFKVNQTMLEEVSFILPPLQLQQTFANRVKLIEGLKATHRASLSELDTLFVTLQHRAFRGEL